MTKETLLIILPIGISFAFIFGGFLCELVAKSKAEQLLIKVARGVARQLTELKNPPPFVHKDRSEFTMKEKLQAGRLFRKWRRKSVEQEGRSFLVKELCAFFILCVSALCFCLWFFEDSDVVTLFAIMFSMTFVGSVARRRQCCVRIPKAFSEAIKPGWALLKELSLYQTEIKGGGKEPVVVDTDMPQDDLEYTLNEDREQRLKIIAEYIAGGGEMFLDDDFMW